MPKFITLSVVALTGALAATAGAFAHGTGSPQGGMPGMEQRSDMQHMQGHGDMMMQGHGDMMMQGQDGMMMDCPMMQRMASLDQRVRQLEERAGIPTPTQPSAPTAPR